MRSVQESRLIFMVNPDLKIIITRPVGFMTGREYADRLFAAYATIKAPWTFNRLSDFRRFEGDMSTDDIQHIADRWNAFTGNVPYHAHVAVVSLDPLAAVRVPAVSPMFPNETLCLFTDYHEALGWLCSRQRNAFLAQLPTFQSASVRQDHRITVS